MAFSVQPQCVCCRAQVRLRVLPRVRMCLSSPLQVLKNGMATAMLRSISLQLRSAGRMLQSCLPVAWPLTHAVVVAAFRKVFATPSRLLVRIVAAACRGSGLSDARALSACILATIRGPPS